MNDAVKAFLYRIQRTPHREAAYDYSTNTRYTYCDLGKRGLKLASYLTRDLGLGPGDVMALVAENNVAFIDAFYASCMTGVIITTYNGRLRPADIVPLVERERPHVMFVSEKYREKMDACRRDARIDCAMVSLDGASNASAESYADIMARRVDVRSITFDGFPDFDIERTQMLVHTGGTTGLPKSAEISFRAVLYNALSSVLTIGITQDCVGLVFLPFFHTAGWNVAMLPHLLSGGRVVLTDTLDPGVLLHLIETERPTTGLAVEAILLSMANHPDFAATDFSSYKFIANGAGPISEAAMKRYWDRGVKIVNAYGMTETGPNNCLHPDCELPLDEIKKHGNTIGTPMCFNELKIVDEDGREVERGIDGELLWRGPVTFSGYWEDPEATAEIMAEGGWVRSGDMGHIDESGFVHLQGRRKSMIITNGENVFPIEIENAIKAYPGVIDCHVIAVPDDTRGEVGKALVVMAEGKRFDRDAIAAFARERLSTIKVPVYYTQIFDLPRRGLKVDLSALQKRYGFAGEGEACDD